MDADRPEGFIKVTPADFVVDEIPAYEPSGEGPHLYVHLKKTGLTTDEAVRSISRVIGVDRRDIGVAGLKDKVAVTTQWISVPAKSDGSTDDAVRALSLPGIEVLEQRRHGNKLKTGHLRGNRFRIVVRGVDPTRTADVERTLARIATSGVPNAFGAQRFGRDADNHVRAALWLTGRERAPGDPRLRRFHFSAFQSHVFNQVLAARVTDGTWERPLLGDLLRKLSPDGEEGGIFICTDVQVDRERAARGEVCPTGPIVGDKMRQTEAEALELEQRIVAPLIEGIDLRRARSLGEGTRRALKLRVLELSFANLGDSRSSNTSSMDEGMSSDQTRKMPVGNSIELRFVLPKGAYATTVLENVVAVREPGHAAGLSNASEDESEPG